MKPTNRSFHRSLGAGVIAGTDNEPVPQTVQTKRRWEPVRVRLHGEDAHWEWWPRMTPGERLLNAFTYRDYQPTMAERQQEILVLLETHGQLDSTAIARLVNAHPLTINRTCMTLVRAGYIHMVSGGNYELTELGKQQLGTDANPKRGEESGR